MNQRVAVELTELGLTLEVGPDTRHTDVTPPACYSDEVLRAEARCEICTRVNAIVQA